MKKITELKKQSKKAQKAFYSAQRGTWYGIKPITRTKPLGYKRAEVKRIASKEDFI